MTYGTVQANAIQGSINTFSPNSAVFRNRIINGAMVIDQRNAGASVSFAASASGYTLDRFLVENVTDGALTVQRSTVAPTGFTNSALITITTADASLGATQRCRILQAIEGFNTADLGFGTANAKSVTLSFWVRSSLTGTFGGALNNGDVNRSYPFTYTISSANTWEQKTITVAGETTGTWNTGNTVGMYVQFGLGVGSTFSGTAGSWATSQIMSATGAVSVVGTNGATFYITGVQLEVGSTATSFDYRPYGTELALCQRYFEKSYSTSTAVATNTTEGYYTMTSTTNANGFLIFPLRFKVEKRGAPIITGYQTDGTSGNWNYVRSGASGTNAVNADNIGTGGCRFFVSTGANYTAGLIEGHWIASAEL